MALKILPLPTGTEIAGLNSLSMVPRIAACLSSLDLILVEGISIGFETIGNIGLVRFDCEASHAGGRHLGDGNEPDSESSKISAMC